MFTIRVAESRGQIQCSRDKGWKEKDLHTKNDVDQVLGKHRGLTDDGASDGEQGVEGGANGLEDGGEDVHDGLHQAAQGVGDGRHDVGRGRLDDAV